MTSHDLSEQDEERFYDDEEGADLDTFDDEAEAISPAAQVDVLQQQASGYQAILQQALHVISITLDDPASNRLADNTTRSLVYAKRTIDGILGAFED